MNFGPPGSRVQSSSHLMRMMRATRCGRPPWWRCEWFGILTFNSKGCFSCKFVRNLSNIFCRYLEVSQICQSKVSMLIHNGSTSDPPASCKFDQLILWIAGRQDSPNESPRVSRIASWRGWSSMGSIFWCSWRDPPNPQNPENHKSKHGIYLRIYIYKISRYLYMLFSLWSSLILEQAFLRPTNLATFVNHSGNIYEDQIDL